MFQPGTWHHPRANRLLKLGHCEVAYEFKRGKRRTIGEREAAQTGISLDLVAVLSFLPIGHVLDSGRLLRLARLVRLAIVVRYAADLLRDFWLVVTRRERLGQLLVLLLSVATLSFVAAALLVLAEPGNPMHGGNLLDAFWWAFLQLESADNIVRSVHEHPALVIASVLLTITGIFLMSFVIGLGTNIVAALLVASRHRPVDLEGHTVLSAPPQAARRILRDLGRLRSRNLPETGRIEGLHFLSPARRLRRLVPRAKILAFSIHSSQEYVVRMARCGVHGYVMKDAPTAKLVEAIVRVHKGGLYFPPGMTDAILATTPKPAFGEQSTVLTAREREVLVLLAEGLANKEVARKLGISVRTAETHREHLSRKLNIAPIAALTKYAIQHGLTPLTLPAPPERRE